LGQILGNRRSIRLGWNAASNRTPGPAPAGSGIRTSPVRGEPYSESLLGDSEKDQQHVALRDCGTRGAGFCGGRRIHAGAGQRCNREDCRCLIFQLIKLECAFQLEFAKFQFVEFLIQLDFLFRFGEQLRREGHALEYVQFLVQFNRVEFNGVEFDRVQFDGARSGSVVFQLFFQFGEFWRIRQQCRSEKAIPRRSDGFRCELEFVILQFKLFLESPLLEFQFILLGFFRVGQQLGRENVSWLSALSPLPSNRH
jgi:hypothetical protein